MDDLLAESAATRRTAALRMAAEARHYKAMGLPPVKRKGLEDIAEVTKAAIVAGLARPRQRIKALEQRILEVEAQNNAERETVPR